MLEVEQGLLNKDQLQRKHGLGGNSTVLKWCLKYGKFAYRDAINTLTELRCRQIWSIFKPASLFLYLDSKHDSRYSI